MNNLNQLIEGKTLYIVSDLHMGDRSPKDNFREYIGRFESFLDDVVDADHNGQLILAGDTFEFWQCQHGTITRAYLVLLKRLVAMKSIFIVGNHDIDLLGFVGLDINSPFIDLLTDQFHLARNGKNILICHGHEFDKFNDPARWLFIGRIAAIAAGRAEMAVGTKVGQEATEGMLLRGLLWLINLCRPKTAGEKLEKGKTIDDVQAKLEKHHTEHPNETVVAGHTHKAGWYGDWYVNAGSWQTDQAHYVKIDTDGTMTLRKWPGNELDETQIWPDSLTAKTQNDCDVLDKADG